MIFLTGFEGTILEKGKYNNELISGFDINLNSNNDWKGFVDNSKIGYAEISYEDGDNSQRKASIVNDPDSTDNHVLKYQVFEPHIKEGTKYKRRVHLAVHDNKCFKELYQKVKLKLHPDIIEFQNRKDRLYWFTLFEFWNNGAWTKEKFPFRVSVNLFKEEVEGSPINFRVKSDYFKSLKWNEVWGETAANFAVKYGEWMEVEVYLKEGDANNGRFYMSVITEDGGKKVLFDIINTTQHPKEKCPDGFTHFELMKMYLGEEDINHMKNTAKDLVIYCDD